MIQQANITVEVVFLVIQLITYISSLFMFASKIDKRISLLTQRFDYELKAINDKLPPSPDK